MLIFALIFLAAIFLLNKMHTPNISLKKSWWIIALIVFFAVMPSLRANLLINFLNICATLGLLMLFSYQANSTPAFLMRLRDYFVLAVFVPFRMLRSALSTVSHVTHVQSTVGRRDVLIRIMKGAVMAVPILIIFGILFSQADLAFSQFVSGLVNITISEHTIQYCIVLGIVFVAALSFLSYLFSPKQAGPVASSEQVSTTVDTGRGIEVLVFLGLISALFLLFIGFQVTYLFGGETNILDAGFTYAEYARRGFFELLAVTMLSLVVLLAAEKYAATESKKDVRFLIPALVLITEVGIVIISAFKRLSLYTDAYGMTLQRFFVAAFIMLLSALFIILAIKFIRSKKEQFFTFGALLSVAAFLITLNLINPDAFIMRSNSERYAETGKVDVTYVRELSSDAVVWELELYNKLEGAEKQTLGELLQKQKDDLQMSRTDWQGTNISRIRAWELLQKIENFN